MLTLCVERKIITRTKFLHQAGSFSELPQIFSRRVLLNDVRFWPDFSEAADGAQGVHSLASHVAQTICTKTHLCQPMNTRSSQPTTCSLNIFVTPAIGSNKCLDALAHVCTMSRCWAAGQDGRTIDRLLKQHLCTCC